MLNWLTLFWHSFSKPLRKANSAGVLPLLAPFVLLVLIGTIAYSQLEGWTLLESLYATIITITTVGYGDLSPQTGAGRVFAIFFTLLAIGLAGYTISTVAAAVFEGRQAKMELKRYEQRMNKIAQLTNHVIVCGGGTLGNRASAEFKRRKTPFVIIETDEEKLKRALLWLHPEYISKRQRHYATLEEVDLSVEERKSIDELAQETGVLYMLQDPTDEQQLRTAGIHHAFGVVAAMEDDRDNTTIILSAKDMATRLNNAKLRIVASAHDESMIHMLYLAGANRVISPFMMGGVTLASQMMDHDTAEFWEQMLYRHDQNMRIGDISLADHPEFIGKTPDDLRTQLSQLIIAIRRNGQFTYTPDPTEILTKDDVLIVIGPHL